ncbi:DUF6167 family protein [Nocardioides nematodiphilus]|uniref:DUF6167 family protein n=1 Tax=Nocardioides nematodiphilus TaxID=2849669 RepID=UPI001CD9F773|nr:DUF6167 family protein [Nocardioides nematodiphilus]MCA1982754.1 DUF6167 family protein [Nocardioides nematodiphilus]
MRRGLWFAAGAGAGIYAVVRGHRAAEALTPDGLRDRWQAIGLGARMLRDEVAQGKAEAEPRLRERFTPSYDPTPQLTSGRDQNALEAPQEGTRSSE